MTLESFLTQLQNVKRRGTRFMATCPAHADKTPSLSVSAGTKGILVRCFAGCTLAEICAALGLAVSDLFYNRGRRASPGRAIPQLPKIDYRTLAFRFELAALDLRLRAQRVMDAVTNFNIDELSETQLDRLMNAVAQVYGDQERADFLETVADDFRVQERMVNRAAA